MTLPDAQRELEAALEWREQARVVAENAAGYFHVGSLFDSPDLNMLEDQLDDACANLREAEALVAFWRGVMNGAVKLG